ncbi:stringent starvation protein B [Methylomarinovum caldicuralii]|uniref:Stringent starvation protein B n=1 Tax=Methylomarinovum caldicuralii TaxID=438856 RepID=A0AAU9BZH3_9GAMM|nr:ClpXP protease specificity-enhancing factor [Methylomarinovum caldicuralii]BCX81467.1 stringent starvation protein B [Methylomarinovum caldicuralii]
MTPLRPYLIRAIYEWIVDNVLTPYVLVDAERDGVDVPRQYVQDGRIVLNLSPTAVVGLEMDNEAVSFQARFSGTPMRVYLPVRAILAIYAQETGRGMVFDEEMDGDETPPPSRPSKPREEKPKAKSKRPALKVVK